MRVTNVIFVITSNENKLNSVLLPVGLALLLWLKRVWEQLTNKGMEQILLPAEECVVINKEQSCFILALK